MAFQFMHVDSFSRSTPKTGKTGGHSVRSIVAEANREPGAIPHIEAPQPPALLFGKPIEELEATCEAWAAGTSDALGRKTRKDALCLLGGVFSAPDGTDPADWERIKGDALEWLQGRYGDRLQTVLEHTDESHPHCHFYVVPRPGESFDVIHDGKRAANELGKTSLKGDRNAAYKVAMRSFQDDYHEHVGAPNGMSRLGPGRRRLTREEWKLEQLQVENIGQKFQQAEALLNQAGETLEASKTTIDALKSSALAEIREMQAKALAAADKAQEDARLKGIEEGRRDAVAEFGKSSLWGKLTGLLSSKDKEIEALKAERKTLKKELKEAKKDGASWMQKATEYLGLKDRYSAKFKTIRNLVADLRGDRDQAVKQRDAALETVKVLRERDEGHHELQDDRDFQKARAELAERKLARYEAPSEPEQVLSGNRHAMGKKGVSLET